MMTWHCCCRYVQKFSFSYPHSACASAVAFQLGDMPVTALKSVRRSKCSSRNFVSPSFLCFGQSDHFTTPRYGGIRASAVLIARFRKIRYTSVGCILLTIPHFQERIHGSSHRSKDNTGGLSRRAYSAISMGCEQDLMR